MLEHVTLPRTGALDVVMKILGPSSDCQDHDKIERIVDMTIAYPNGKPLDLQSIVVGWREPCDTHVHYRSWNIKVENGQEQKYQSVLTNAKLSGFASGA